MTQQRQHEPFLVEINGEQYVFTDRINPFIQGYVPRQTNPFRLQGVQATKDDPSVNRFRSPSFPLGIGWERMNRETGRGVGGLLDSTWDTGHIPATLGRLQETQTHADPVQHLVKAVNFKGDWWGLWEEDFDAAEITNLFARLFGATSDDWTGGGTILTPDSNDQGSRGFDMVVHKSRLYVLGNGGSDTTPNTGTNTEECFGLYASSDGASWAAAGTLTGFPDDPATQRWLVNAHMAQNISQDFANGRGKLLSYGNDLIVAMFAHPDSTAGDGTIKIYFTSDAAANFTAGATIPSSDGPKAFLDWVDRSGNRAPCLITPDGIYALTTTSTSYDTADLLYELDGDPNNGLGAAIDNQGALVVGLGNGDVLWLFRADTNTLEVRRLGPPGDGLVTARRGHATYIYRTPTKWLLIGYGGHAAATFASIFKVNTAVWYEDPDTRETFSPWHHVWEDTTGNLDIINIGYSTEDDATARLHWTMEGAAATVNYHIEEPFVHPNQSSTIKYQATSILRLPDDDLGDPHSSANVVQVMVNANDLTAGTGGSGGASDVFITCRFGTNGSSDTSETLGDFLSGTRTLLFGASNQGVAARTVAINLLGDGGATNTDTPKMYEFEIQGYHNYVDKKFWEGDIDIEATALSTAKPNRVANTPIQETIISALETIAESSVGVTLTVGGMTQLPVQCPADQPPAFTLWVVNSTNVNRGYRTGFCHIKLVDAVVAGWPAQTNYTIGASGDDGGWNSTQGGGANLTATQLGVGVDQPSTTFQRGFLRYDNVAIAQGSIVQNAFIRFKCHAANTGAITTWRFRAVDSDDGVAPTTYAEAVALSYISTSVSWVNMPAWIANEWYTSVDISPLVQAIVNRPGWVSGNAVVFAIWETGTDVSSSKIRRYKTYDSAPADAPIFHVEV